MCIKSAVVTRERCVQYIHRTQYRPLQYESGAYTGRNIVRTTMNHFHSMLIDDCQWVAHCVEARCSFVNTGYGYVCPWHNTIHRCILGECALVNGMTTLADDCGSSCLVAYSAAFRTPELEFNGSYYVANTDNAVEGYGSVHASQRVVSQTIDMEGHVPTLKAAVPALIALFATMETEEFRRDYQRIADNKSSWHCPHGSGHSPWTNVVIERTKRLVDSSVAQDLHIKAVVEGAVKDLVLRSVVALCTMFDSPYNNILRFMRKVTCKHHDSETSEFDFYVLVIMAALCTFPYLRHDLCVELDVKILVVMCFDKTATKHNQWSNLSTYVHQHANRAEFLKRVACTDTARAWLPTIIRETVDDYIMKLPVLKQQQPATMTQEEQSVTGSEDDGGCERVDAESQRMPTSRIRRKRRLTTDNVFVEYTEPAAKRPVVTQTGSAADFSNVLLSLNNKE